MKAQKIITLVMAGTLALTPVVSAYAASETVIVKASSSADSVDESNAKISKEKAKEAALKTLKDSFGVEIDEKNFESRVELRQDYEFRQRYVWQIAFYQNNSDKNINHNVGVDADTGKIISVDSREYEYRPQPTISKITEDQAKTEADNFVKKVNAKEYGQLKLMDNPGNYPAYKGNYPLSYTFRYVQIINGIEFERNMITVGVDGVTGKITSYNYRWHDELSMPDTQGAITKAEAEELFKNEADLSFRYISFRNKYDYNGLVKNVKLVYGPEFPNGFQLDAKEGKFINWNGSVNEVLEIKDIKPEEKETLSKSVKASEKHEKEIDDNRASSVVKEQLKALIGDSYEIDTLRYIESDNYWENSGRKVWSANFYKKEGDVRRPQDGGQIMIDALTEEIVSLNQHYFYEETDDSKFESALTWEQAYGKAIEIIAKYYPNRLKDVKTEQKHIKSQYVVNGKDMGERVYYFTFPRIVNGIPYTDNNISIGFDAKTGLVRNLRYIWNDELQFPDTKGSITREDALETFFEHNKPELIYTLINKSKDYNKPEMEAKLVYTLRSPERITMPMGIIDAFTGKYVDYTGEEMMDKEDGFKEKIKGLWAEKELEILAFHGIVETKDFKPDKEITRLEALKMLINAKGYRPDMIQGSDALKFSNISKDDANYNYLQMAVNYGIIEDKEGPFEGEAVLTREQMAEMLVKLLQYEKLAKAREIFALTFSDAGDISEDKYGFVAIGKGLGILEGNDGKFRPKDKVTMVEFAVAVYKALENIRNTNY